MTTEVAKEETFICSTDKHIEGFLQLGNDEVHVIVPADRH